MLLAVLAVVGGLVLLAISADRFIGGAAALARHFGLSPLLIGMVIIGFGTSAPELVVSTMAALDGKPALALGNAYGSNIANIGLILGCAALLKPITVGSSVLRKELPALTLVTALAAWLIWDLRVSRADAWVLLGVFALLVAWALRTGLQGRGNGYTESLQQEYLSEAMGPGRAAAETLVGLLVLLVSSRLLVWGAVTIAEALGVSELIIGLTVVAVGTSLPELASAVAAIRKGEDDLVLGNVLGSNLFNTLAVVGLAGAVMPFSVDSDLLSRDLPLMAAMTLSLFAFGYRLRAVARINRIEGGLLLAAYAGYVLVLVMDTLTQVTAAGANTA